MNQWVLLFDPERNINVAAVVYSPLTGEIIHQATERVYSDAIDILQEKGPLLKTVVRPINGMLASFEESFSKDDPDYLVNFLNPILKPTRIGSRGTSHIPPAKLIDYLSGHLIAL